MRDEFDKVAAAAEGLRDEGGRPGGSKTWISLVYSVAQERKFIAPSPIHNRAVPPRRRRIEPFCVRRDPLSRDVLSRRSGSQE
jgi:hypothetical protein